MSIPLFSPSYRVNECLIALRECLESGNTGSGNKTIMFEQQWQQYTGFTHALFVNSASSGLSIALEVLKMKNNWHQGDEIITSPITFVSANHTIRELNLKPVFADVDEYLSLDPNAIEKRLTPRTKAVMFTGIGGNTGQYERVVELCQNRGLALILNAAHLAGTRLHGTIPGQDADAVVYSFHADKNLPIADSGMVCFHTELEARLARKLSNHGIHQYSLSQSSSKFKQDQWKYDVEHIGIRAYGNSIMAAIGIVQLQYLDDDNRFRSQVSDWYRAALEQHCPELSIVPTAPDCSSSHYLFMLRVPWRNQLMLYLNALGIRTGIHYRPNTEYRMYRHGRGQCPYADNAAREIISLPIHLKMTYTDVQTIVLAIAGYAQQQCKPTKGQE